jgi:hypothetical protein
VKDELFGLELSAVFFARPQNLVYTGFFPLRSCEEEKKNCNKNSFLVCLPPDELIRNINNKRIASMTSPSPSMMEVMFGVVSLARSIFFVRASNDDLNQLVHHSYTS